MGNCGVGFAPVKIEDRQRLIELMEGVEDIPGAALDEGLNWSWESFGQFLDALDAKPRDMDLGAQLPHGALRVFVMGERAAKLEEATADEVAEMRKLTAEAMRDGALGFSTSRTLNHRTVKGDPTPSLRASGRLDVSWLVKRHTSDNARAVGLNDRGRVAPGSKADLNVIDFDRLRVEAPVMTWDLPAGGKRLLQRATGYRATIVSGAVTYRDGEATGALPGRLVRGPQVAAG